MITFWLSMEEAEATRSAAEELGTNVSDECRKALRAMVKRAERKKASDQ